MKIKLALIGVIAAVLLAGCSGSGKDSQVEALEAAGKACGNRIAYLNFNNDGYGQVDELKCVRK